ncbi:MAG: glutathione S-transferase family protein, partial [Gammaproteobacteria bacterium]|nr:glutathione S-transferase family protein [Gammaproteobacteria bacterium]
LNDYPLVRAWADALMESDIVTGSVPDVFEEQFIGNLKAGGFLIAELLERSAG